MISAFSWYTGCNISEAAVDDPRMYPNLGEFFRRTLKPGLRPIAPGDCVVSKELNQAFLPENVLCHLLIIQEVLMHFSMFDVHSKVY